MTDATAVEAAGQPRSKRFWGALRKRWVPLVLVFASLVMGFTVTAHHTKALSPIDEWVYADYLYKLPGQLIVPRGQPIGEQALGLMACTGLREYGPMGPDCGSDYAAHLDEFPQHGISSADGYTPLYFVITWVGAKAIQAVTDTSIVQAARYTGALWLAGGMLLFYWLLSLLRVKRVVALGLGLAVIASPFAWWTYTFVSTDAPVFALGALTLIAAVKFRRGEWSGWWLPLIGAVATLFKITSILAVILAALYLVFEYIMLRVRERPRRRGFQWRTAITGRGDDSLVLMAVLAGLASLIAEVGWLAVRAAVAVGPAADQGVTGRMSLKDLGSQFVNFLPGTITSNVNITGRIPLGLPIPLFILEPLSWITIAGVLGAVAVIAWRRVNGPLVYAIAIMAILGAPLLAISLSLQGTYFPIPPRYGAALLPSFLLAAGLLVRTKVVTVGLVAYPAVLLGIVLLYSPMLA